MAEAEAPRLWGGTVAPARRHARAGCAVLAAALALSGCSFAPTPAPSIAWSTATPSAASATPTPRTSTAPPVLDEGTVVATGTFVGDDRISGDAEVRVNGAGTFELRLLGFHSTHDGEISVRLSPRPVEPGTKCTSSIMTLDYGPPTTDPVQVFPLMKDFTQGDPSFLDTVIISVFDAEAHTSGCYVPIVASTILEWTIPDMRPGLIVTDSGSTGGASGAVTLADGVPVSYTVTYYDLAEEVAARFGITVQDLFYLNPVRVTMVADPLLEVGEVLNLSKAHR